MEKGHIIKLSHGTFNETAKADHVSVAHNINTNAALKSTERAGHGVKYDKTKPRKLVNPDTLDVTIGVFFDGTGNNASNTKERLSVAGQSKKEQKNSVYEKNTDHESSSYENDFSNVYRLWNNFAPQIPKYVYRIYIDGIGTQSHKEDDSTGTATGSGKTGIAAKVAIGCKAIAVQLDRVASGKSSRIINSLTLDVFGFSRGAAAARHFVYEIGKPTYKAKSINKTISTGEEFSFSAQQIHYMLDDMNNETEFADFPYRGYLGAWCKKLNIQIKVLTVRFVGLFDCVASFHDGLFIPSTGSDTPKQFKDNSKLHLDAIAVAQRVVHLTASDEHRGNFPLTTIASAGSKGRSFSLPGVHSDVGGCYKNDIIEKVNPLYVLGSDEKMNAEKERLVSEGWFDKDELYFNEYLALASKRMGILNTYSFIPLHIMAHCAINYTTNYTSNNIIPFNVTRKVEDQYSIAGDALLMKIKPRLEAQVFKGIGPLKFKYFQEIFDKYHVTKSSPMPPECNTEIEEQKYLRRLRHRYLHWNSNYETVYGVLHPMYPRLDHGVRQRFIIPG